QAGCGGGARDFRGNFSERSRAHPRRRRVGVPRLAPPAARAGALGRTSYFGRSVNSPRLSLLQPATIEDARVVRWILTHLGLAGDEGPPPLLSTMKCIVGYGYVGVWAF